ncbi:MAG: hypothetical protein ACE5MK_06450 [Acidobacteriota bacterium]
MFCFFHLGSDAQLEVTEQGDNVHVAVKHRRVEPFEFNVAYQQLEELLSDSAKLERFLLEEVTPHRR